MKNFVLLLSLLLLIQFNLQSQSGLFVKFNSGANAPIGTNDGAHFYPDLGFRVGSTLGYEFEFCRGMSLGLGAAVHSQSTPFDKDKGRVAAAEMAVANNFTNDQLLFEAENSNQTLVLFGPSFNYTIGKLKWTAWFSGGRTFGKPISSKADINLGDLELLLIETKYIQNYGNTNEYGTSFGFQLNSNINISLDAAFTSTKYQGDQHRLDLKDAILPISINQQSLFLGLGLKITPCPRNSSRATDHNSSRSNKTSSSVAPDDKGGSGNGGQRATDYNSSRSNKSEKSGVQAEGGDELNDAKTRATDHNSSRSNKTSSSVAPDDNGGSGDGSQRATDHNSSRSNKTSSSVAPDDKGGSGNNGQRATDYNSSRSNKSEKSGVQAEGGDEVSDGKTRATDHNSSRSNKTSSSVAPDDKGGSGNNGQRATDYNSSRSNKSEKSGVQAEGGDEVSDGKTRATDHNSSRSNKTSSSVAPDDKGGSGNNGQRATDYNSSRSNKTSSSVAPDDKGGKGDKKRRKNRKAKKGN